MKNRIKLKTPVITTRAQAESLVGEITELINQHRQVTTDLDSGITLLKQQVEGPLAALKKAIDEKTTVAQAWAEANPSEFQGRKSLDMVHAVVGWRTGQPQLKTLSGWTWDRVLEKLKSITQFKPFIRTKEEVDKQTIIAQREGLWDSDLRNMGVRITQDEAFFIEPKLTTPETRQEGAA